MVLDCCLKILPKAGSRSPAFGVCASLLAAGRFFLHANDTKLPQPARFLDQGVTGQLNLAGREYGAVNSVEQPATSAAGTAR